MSLSALMAGVSEENEARCDAWMAAGEELRAAVAWRVFQGNGDVMEAVTGVPQEALTTFVETGLISAEHRAVLEVSRGA
jgi:negative regulator of sigma E activity